MAGTRDVIGAQPRSRTPARRHQVTRSQGVKKAPAKRRSERISKLQRTLDGRKPEKRHASLSVRENQPPPLPLKRQKRLREAESPTNSVSIERPQKRLRQSPSDPSQKQTLGQGTYNRLSASQQSYISHWAEENTWPKEYFQKDSMHHLLARPKPSASLRRKRSGTSLTHSATLSDQRPREEKSAPYRNVSYPTLLKTLSDSYIDESPLGITDVSKALYKDLLKRDYTTPKETLFSDNVFDAACQNVRDKNEARIILDFAQLLAPSPESLAAFGTTDLNILVKSINEGWNNSDPITSSRP